MEKFGLTYPEKLTLEQYINTTFTPYQQEKLRKRKLHAVLLKKYPLNASNYRERLDAISFLGAGQDGFTYLMSDSVTKAVVVVKFTLPVERELVIAEALTPLRTRHLVPFPEIYDYFTITPPDKSGRQFGVLIEEYVIGPTLSKWLSGPFTIEDLTQVIVQMLQALQILVEYGVSHTDLVFSNMVWDPILKHLYFIDFGRACFLRSSGAFGCPSSITLLEDLQYIITLWKKYLVNANFRPIWRVLEELLARATKQPEEILTYLSGAVTKLQNIK